jgi:hypothetical protein
VDGIDDGDAGGEFAEICAADKIGDEGIDGKRAEENDTGMGARRILALLGSTSRSRSIHIPRSIQWVVTL